MTKDGNFLREVPEALHVRRTHQTTRRSLARSFPYTLIFIPSRSDAWLLRTSRRIPLVFCIFDPFRTSFLKCKPYGAKSHFFTSCQAFVVDPTGPVSWHRTLAIRALFSVRISPGYLQWLGLHVSAMEAVSGPWRQTHSQTDRRALLK